jgi:trimeric autotransporter adhesin
MPSRINSTTTSPGGLISTGDSDNSLLIQTGDTTAITISSTQQVSLTNPLPVSSGGTGSNTGVNAATSITGVLPIANGGTGANTATAAFNALNPMTTTGDILYEASPTVAARLAIGSTGQVLTVSGGIPAWGTISSGPSGITSQVFTSNGTFTIPSGVTALKVTVQAGSGGSGGASATACGNSLSGGTGGGGAGIKYLTGLTPGNTISVVVGGGGASTASGGNSSISSGTQSIGTVTATGSAGTSSATAANVTAGSAGGTATGADLVFQGEQGIANNNALFSVGGGSLLGQGTVSNTNQQPGRQGTGYGSGSCGVFATGFAFVSGAAGRAGVVIFEW